MSSPLLLGIDVGSSDCKVMLIDAAGNIIAEAAQPYPTRYPQPAWAEVDPEDWYQAAGGAVRECLDKANIDRKAIAAVAVDGPAHNVALLGHGGEVLYPTIHWSDLRSTPQAERLQPLIGNRIFELTYTRVNPSWTLTQLVWLKENEPTIWSRLRQILITKDYVRYRLTGAYATDPYDAIGTQLYEAAEERWSNEICAFIDLDLDCLPPVLHPAAIAGTITDSAAQYTGLLSGTPVIVSSGDSVIEALGIGAINAGQVLVKLGTAANVNMVTAKPLPSPQSITYPHVVDRWFTITATNAGASTMRWFRDIFCRLEVEQATAQGINVYKLIDQLAGSAPPGADGLLFHPYLMGERTPHWNPYLRASFTGIGAHHSTASFARAILEGVAFSLRDCLGVVVGLGQPVDQAFIIGGGSKSVLWRQVIADVLGIPLIKPAVEDAAYGAAVLAGVGIGIFHNVKEAVAICTRHQSLVEANLVYTPLYNELFKIYQEMAQDMAQYSRRLSQLSHTHLVGSVTG